MAEVFGEEATVDTDASLTATIEQIVNNPSTINSDVIANMLKTLKSHDAVAELIVSADIIQNLTSAPDSRSSWFKYEIFLTKCLVMGVISPKQLEDVILPILKQSHPEEVLDNFASCLKSLVETYRREKSQSHREEEFLEILDWISWLCQKEQDVQF